jgi:hypothetical protein
MKVLILWWFLARPARSPGLMVQQNYDSADTKAFGPFPSESWCQAAQDNARTGEVEAALGTAGWSSLPYEIVKPCAPFKDGGPLK